MTVLAARAALAGVAVLLAGVVVAVVSYGGRNAEPYSFLRHFVSELGWQRSAMAWWFNCCLTLGSLMFLPMLYALGLRVQTRLGYAAMWVGFCAVLAGSSVGIFSMECLLPHLCAAAFFFVGWFLTVSLFTLALGLNRTGESCRGMVATGIVAALCCAVFLALPKESLLRFLSNPDAFPRPQVWWLAVMEWGVFFSMCAWASVAAVVLWRWPEASDGRE